MKNNVVEKMSTVKVYQIKATVNRGGKEKFSITREFRATKPEDAIDRFYSLLGSWHRVKRRMIVIEEIKEITSPDDIKTPLIREMVEADKNELIIPYKK